MNGATSIWKMVVLEEGKVMLASHVASPKTQVTHAIKAHISLIREDDMVKADIKRAGKYEVEPYKIAILLSQK